MRHKKILVGSFDPNRHGEFMGLTEAMVLNYLVKARSLKAINNHDVKDSTGNKTGQMLLSIEIGKQLIDKILEQDNEQLAQEEMDALFNLREALDDLPLSMNIHSLWSAVMGLDSIQKKLLDSVNVYLASITQLAQHELLLKTVVLVLKILEYDLSKKTGPINIGYGFFKLQVLSDEQRIENHTQIRKLLTGIIEQFNEYYEEEQITLDNKAGFIF